jgi:hypothetical protein
MQLRVECYSGYKLNERPLRFFLNGRGYDVAEVVDQWHGPNETWFRVRADDGFTYVLKCSDCGNQAVWTLAAYRG